MATLSYDYDYLNDVMTIEGIRYSGDVFRGLGLEKQIPVGSRIFLDGRRDGVIWLRHELPKDAPACLSSMFSWKAGRTA